MVDVALAAIRRCPRPELTYQWFRRKFMADGPGLWATLDRGHAMLQTLDQLNQYLWSYGPMIQAQWQYVAAKWLDVTPPERLIDYGCGQGLGGLLLNDYTEGAALAKVSEVVLIEPSAPALARAEAIYRRLCPQADVQALRKEFAEVSDSDVAKASEGSTLHLFSNTLDVPGYDPLALLSNTPLAGQQTLFALSHDREHDGGTPRIRHVKNAFEDPAMGSDLTIRLSTLEQFKCGDNDRWDGVIWRCDFEVHDD